MDNSQMEDAQQQRTKFLQQATQDGDDIRALRDNQAFNRYFMRRLKQEQQKIYNRFRNDDPSKVSHEEREILRRSLDIYEDVMRMMEKDENGIKLVIDGHKTAIMLRAT